MEENTLTSGFDPEQFLEELLAEMPMQNEPPEVLEMLKQSLIEQMNQVIMIAVANNIEPEVMDAVFEVHEGEEDNDYLFAELISNSPNAQIAIVEGLEAFREETLQTYKELTHAA